MRKNLKAKTLESLSSVMPITAIVLVLSFTLAPEMPVGTLMMFLLGAILLFVGMAAGVIVLGIKYGVEKRKNHSGDPGGAQQ